MSCTYVNSTCPFCKKRFNRSLKQIVVCYPCEHYYHKECFNECIGAKCNVESCKYTLVECKSKNAFHSTEQHAINLLSLERTPYVPSYFDIFRAIFYRVPLISYYLFWFLIGKKSYFALQNLLTNVNNILNVNVKLIGDEHLDDKKKIYVLNHCSFLDVLIVPRCIISGAVASISQASNSFGKMMKECTHVYFVERGKSNNSVEKIQNHIEEKGSLLFCPQGIFSHIWTLPLFRTGAFATKYNVQPLLVLYKQNVSSLSMFNILCYPQVDVTVKILPEVTKGVDEHVNTFAERVRRNMSQEGNLFLSNVSSRDIVD